MANLGLPKIKVFWNKSYDITSKMLLRDSNSSVDVVMWPKFGHSRISMRDVIITSISWGFDQKNQFFEGCFWFKLNKMGFAVGLPWNFTPVWQKG